MKDRKRIGRPPVLPEPPVKRTISLMSSEWERLWKIGGGYTAGIRELLKGRGNG